MGIKIRNNIPLLLMGVGLIVLGLVAAGVIANGGISSDYSVIPSAVNFPAPNLTLNNLDGDRVSISDFQQQVLLINNWATWCPPCRDEMPTLVKYFNEHNEQGLMLIGINAGDPIGEVEQFLEEYDITFPILLDPNNKSLIVFNNENLPSSYVIDRKGNVVLAWTGPISKDMLEKYVTPLLEQ
jgi:peroxiredoxin